jgi:hypothetical protein
VARQEQQAREQLPQPREQNPPRLPMRRRAQVMPRVARIRNNFFLFIFSSNTYFFAIPHNSRLPTSLCSGKILVWYKKTAIFGKPGFLQGISLSF